MEEKMDKVLEIIERLTPENQTGNVIALITVCVTLLLGVLGFVFNALIQRRNNSIKVITEDRIARRKVTRDVVARFLPCADPECLKLVTSDEEKKSILRICTECVVMLRSLYTFTSEHDRDLVFAAIDLKDVICRILYEGELCEKELTERTKYFLKMADLYMVTEWKRIKKETNCKYMDGNKGYNAWNDVWGNHEEYYEENRGEKPETEPLVEDKKMQKKKRKKRKKSKKSKKHS